MERVVGTTKRKNRAFAAVICLLWGALTLINLLVPDQAFSQSENRYLSQFPYVSSRRLLSGDFMQDINVYLNDQFVQRPFWVSCQSLLEYGLGKREINGIYIGKNALYRNNPAEKPSVTRDNIQGINAFAQRYGIPTTVMLIPSSTYIYRDVLPLGAEPWDEGAYIEDVYQRLDAGIVTVELTEILEKARGDYIYYRTDHHWTSAGAWLGYQALCRATGLPDRGEQVQITPLSSSFLGTSHSRTGFPLVQADVMELYQTGTVLRYEVFGLSGNTLAITEYEDIYFPEYLEQKDKYSYFLGTLQPYVTIYTQADTDRKLIIFKDSYAHCLTPMLLADYSEIRLVDLRSYMSDDNGSFVEAERYDEALFLYSTDTFSQQPGPGRLA